MYKKVEIDFYCFYQNIQTNIIETKVRGILVQANKVLPNKVLPNKVLPNTGDHNQILLISIGMISIIGIGFVYFYQRRKK